jgi:cold shock CspA family protein
MKSREYGTIATYNGTYAFIKPDAAEKDVFAHESELPSDSIHRGDRVSYDLVPDTYRPGRMKAARVRFVDESKPDGGVNPGMFARPAREKRGPLGGNATGVMAEGLRKLLRDPQRDGETNP